MTASLEIGKARMIKVVMALIKTATDSQMRITPLLKRTVALVSARAQVLAVAQTVK